MHSFIIDVNCPFFLFILVTNLTLFITFPGISAVGFSKGNLSFKKK